MVKGDNFIFLRDIQKLFGVSMMYVSMYIIVRVYIIASVWARAPLWWVLAMGCHWLVMSFWLSSVFPCVQDKREGLVWHCFPVWFPASHLGQNFRPEQIKHSALKHWPCLLVVLQCVCAHVYVHVWALFLFSAIPRGGGVKLHYLKNMKCFEKLHWKGSKYTGLRRSCSGLLRIPYRGVLG